MVDTIRTLLDPDIVGSAKWKAEQWSAYCGLVLITLRDYMKNSINNHSRAINQALYNIEKAVSGLYKLNGVANTWEDDSVQCLEVVMDFIRDAVEILDEKGKPKRVRLRVRVKYGHPHESLYDDFANMIFEVMFNASHVKTPQWNCWSIQHNSIWSPISRGLNGPGGRVVRFKLHRLLYDEITHMSEFPNFKGAKILGFCLNVMGLEVPNGEYAKENRPLHIAILGWTRKNFVWLNSNWPSVAEACLVDGITYDSENYQLVKTYAADGMRREADYDRLNLESGKPDKDE